MTAKDPHSSKPKRPPSGKSAPGPEPQRLKLEGPWEDRVRDSFKDKVRKQDK